MCCTVMTAKKKTQNLMNNSQIPCIKDMFDRLSKKIMFDSVTEQKKEIIITQAILLM